MWTNAEGIQYPYDNPIVITLNIINYDVNLVLVNNGSSMDVTYYDALLKINILPIQLKEMCGPVPIEEIIGLLIIAYQAP